MSWTTEQRAAVLIILQDYAEACKFGVENDNDTLNAMEEILSPVGPPRLNCEECGTPLSRDSHNKIVHADPSITHEPVLWS